MKIPIYYKYQVRCFHQNQDFQQYNVCLLQEQFTEVRQVKIYHVINSISKFHTPILHFRFKKYINQSQQNNDLAVWMDVSDPFFKAPLINNAIYVKILRIPQNKSRIYTKNMMEKIKDLKVKKDKKMHPTHDIIQIKPKNIEEQSFFFDQIEQQQVKQIIQSNQTNKLDRIRQIWEQNQNKKKQEDKYEIIAKQKIKKWAYQGKVRNTLRNLLATLHTVSFNQKWKEVSMGEIIVMNEQNLLVKYKQARNMFHPDKYFNIPQKKVTAVLIFDELNKAKNDYDIQKQKNLQNQNQNQ